MKEEPQEWERSDGDGESKKGCNWGMIVIGVVVVGLVVLLSIPMVSRGGHHRSERTEAINNAKQIGLALLEFDQEFGSFPDAETAAMVKKATGTKLDLSGTSSNAMFRQLIAYGMTQSHNPEERLFYCEHPEGIRRPDKVLSEGKALEAGEVGFSYLLLDGVAQNTSGNPGRSVLAAPMKIGTEEFWPKTYGDKAIILRLDNSVEVPLIRKADGKVSIGDGKTLFDTGEGTVWGNDGPVDIRHPERGR